MSSEHAAATHCRLLSGSDSLWMQFCLLWVAGGMLILKNVREGGRPFNVFLKDVFKQGCGAFTGHVVGMTVAMELSIVTHNENLQCGWYVVTFTVDTVLGTYLTFRLLRRAEAAARRLGAADVAATGVYPSVAACAKQTLLFMVLVAAARVLCGTVVLLSSPLLVLFVKALCGVFEGRPTLFLACAMLLGPGCLNLVQYYVQDSFLQGTRRGEASVRGVGGLELPV